MRKGTEGDYGHTRLLSPDAVYYPGSRLDLHVHAGVLCPRHLLLVPVHGSPVPYGGNAAGHAESNPAIGEGAGSRTDNMV